MKRFLAILTAFVLMFLSAAASAESATDKLKEMYAEAELQMALGNYGEAAGQFEQLGPYGDASQMAMYCKALMSAETLGSYDLAIGAFQGLGDFKDSQQMVVYYTARKQQAFGDSVYAGMTDYSDSKLRDGIKSYREAEEGYAALALFKDSINRFGDCQTRREALSDELEKRAEADREEKYQQALALENQGEYQQAIELFTGISGYKDSKEHITACENAIKEGIYRKAQALEQEGNYRKAIDVYQTVLGYKDTDDRIAACENAIKEGIYQEALALEQAGQYQQAIGIYQTVAGYKDADARITACENAIKDGVYQQALTLEKERKYQEAIDLYQTVSDYQDAEDRIAHCRLGFTFLEAFALENEGKYKEALDIYSKLPGFEDVDEHMATCRQGIFREAMALAGDGRYLDGIRKYNSVCNDLSKDDQIAFRDKLYEEGLACEAKQDYENAVFLFKALENDKDCPARLEVCSYGLACSTGTRSGIPRRTDTSWLVLNIRTPGNRRRPAGPKPLRGFRCTGKKSAAKHILSAYSRTARLP